MENVIIRPVVPDDAAAFLALKMQLDRETTFMMYEPGERRTTVDETRREIHAMQEAGNQTALVAEVAGRLAGYIGIQGGEFRRNRHCAYIVAGVLQEYAGRGIGTRLFEEGEAWARRNGILRLELTVMVHNEPGIRLYRRRGFSIEGTRRAAMHVGGELVDEYYMGKVFDIAGQTPSRDAN